MTWQHIRKAAVVFLVGMSLYGSGHLAYDYLQAVFGTPQSQWQFGLMLAPAMVVLSGIAVVVAYVPKPRLPMFFVLGS